MSRPWPMSRLLDEVIARCGLERPDRIEDGALIYRDGGIRHTLHVGKDKHNKQLFGWSVESADEKYHELIRVPIWRPRREAHPLSGDPRGRDRYFWPRTGEDLDPDAVHEIARYGRPAVSFVRDRADLGRLLLSADDVHRGPVWGKLPPGESEAIRLVNAVIIARDSGDADLEAAAMAKLAGEGDRDVSWAPGHPYLFRDAVADHAKKVAGRVDVDLSDLIPKSPRRARRR
ncbi:MAG: hypothetical protein ACJ72W_30235 [Actinoallomurus sp.]